MTANERISKAKGECRHDTVPRKGEQHKCKLCGKWHTGPTQYDSDPAAWSPEHFQWIEEEGLWRSYIKTLGKMLCNKDTMDELDGTLIAFKEGLDRGAWLVHIATPLQKATALDAALRETKKPHA